MGSASPPSLSVRSSADGKLRWFKQLMETYRKDGYILEIFFVFADEKVMEERAKSRAKETGRQTDRKHVRHTLPLLLVPLPC